MCLSSLTGPDHIFSMAYVSRVEFQMEVLLICRRCFHSETTQIWVISRCCFAESIYGNVQSSKTHVLSNYIFCLATSLLQAVVVCHKSLINTRKRVHSDNVKPTDGNQFTLVMGKLARCVNVYERWWIKWKNKNKTRNEQTHKCMKLLLHSIPESEPYLLDWNAYVN